MAKRPLEELLATALRDLDAGHPATERLTGAEAKQPLDSWLHLRHRLAASPRLDPSTLGRMYGKQQMLAALATPPVHTGGFQMITSLFTMVPKAAALVIGGLVLTGSAVGASAAVGGPNLPVAALTAIGLHAESRSTAGIKNASDASQTGKDHANGKSALGSGNASAQVTGTVEAGINRAPDAAQTGKDRANERAFLGAGNASVDATATVTAGVGVGIGNAPDPAQVGVDHAAANASLGSGNAVIPAITATVDTGIGRAPAAAEAGLDHAADAAISGAFNVGTHRP